MVAAFSLPLTFVSWISKSLVSSRGFLILGLLMLGGCGGSSTGLNSRGMSVLVQVFGGFAGVEYSFEVSGTDRAVLGVTCRSGCEFGPGDLLVGLSVDQVQRIAEDMEATGILEKDGTDFGNECCDQFYFVVTYHDGSRESTVRGNEGKYPSDLREVLSPLLSMAQKRASIRVDFTRPAEQYPHDALEVNDIRISGSVLLATVSYGGGCQRHDIGLVATGPWLESEPVQVAVTFTHDANDDPCDAYLTEVREFELAPLIGAYRSAYPGTQVGQATLRLNVGAYPSDPESRSLLLNF